MKKSSIVILAILGFVLLFWISCSPKVSYCNNLPCCFNLATEEHLYLLLTINKMEDQDHSLFVEPELCHAVANQLFYLLDISADGTCRAIPFTPFKEMHGTRSVFGIEFVQCDDGLAFFDCCSAYWFDGEKIGQLPPKNAVALSKIFEEIRGKECSRKLLDEWNHAHGVISEEKGERNDLREPKQLDWKQHHFEFTITESWPKYYELTISAPSLWQNDFQMKVPYDKLPRRSHPKKEPDFGPVEVKMPSPKIHLNNR